MFDMGTGFTPGLLLQALAMIAFVLILFGDR